MSKRFFSELLMTLLVTFSLIVGWHQREEYWLTAEKGWGYALGIIGGTMLLLLLLYPLRKHWKQARNWFPVAHWFRMHMIFGILGPVLILFHSNFHLGSLNSQVALFSMLLVASSGLVGRYAYRKTHRGLYGKKIAFSELEEAFGQSKSHFREGSLFDETLAQSLNQIESYLVSRENTLFKGIRYQRQIKKIQKVIGLQSRSHVKSLLTKPTELRHFTQQTKFLMAGLTQLKDMASYSIYTRVFSLWHLFHLPIFFIMIFAGITHVFVVHIY